MNQTLSLTHRWTAEGDVTSVPKATFQDPHGNSRFSDRWIEDGSYLKLKSVTLSYTLPMNYTFIWGMCGENQDYDDMDHIQTKDLK